MYKEQKDYDSSQSGLWGFVRYLFKFLKKLTIICSYDVRQSKH